MTKIYALFYNIYCQWGEGDESNLIGCFYNRPTFEQQFNIYEKWTNDIVSNEEKVALLQHGCYNITAYSYTVFEIQEVEIQ